MDRREFFRRAFAVLATTAVAELDIERLLWVPGERTIFLPSTFDVHAVIMREGLKILKQQLTFTRLINRQYDDASYGEKVLEFTTPKRGGDEIFRLDTSVSGKKWHSIS